MLGSGCGVMPNASSIDACATSSTPSEATSLASGEELRSGRKTTNSVTAPTATTNTRLSGSAAAVGSDRDLAGVQRPVGVAAEHRHAAGGEVDDPGAPVGEHHAERDAGDQRAGTEPEQDEQQDLLHWSVLAGWRDAPGVCCGRGTARGRSVRRAGGS